MNGVTVNFFDERRWWDATVQRQDGHSFVPL
jgi:hypothetical protein